MKAVVSCQFSRACRQAGVVRKEIFLSLLSAVLLILSFPQWNLEFLAWFAFVPLLLAIENKSPLKAFLLSYLSGIVFWTGAIYWLVHVTLLGQIFLILYLALYFGLFGLVVSIIVHRPSAIDAIVIPSLWVFLEYVRSHLLTGFPWALLGYSQYLNLPMIQFADITGAWGVSFLVMMVNVELKEVLDVRYQALGQEERKKKISTLILTVLILFSIFVYGCFKVKPSLALSCLSAGRQQAGAIGHQPSAVSYEPSAIKVSVIQGNIPQELKWDARAKDYIVDQYLGITHEATKEKVDFIIWPEAALPIVLEDEPPIFHKIASFVRAADTPLLLGAVTRRDNYYNSALLVSRQGQVIKKYDKLHLVPFGEYIPLRKALPFLETIVPIGDFSSGEEFTVFTLPTLSVSRRIKFAVLICFEDLFPQLSRAFVNKGAGFLVNITNDAWFKETSAPYQHLCASVFRAVENRVYVVRAANTGVSGFISPKGKIISLVRDAKGKNIFISGFQSEIINAEASAKGFYSRHGDFFIAFCLFFCVYGIALRLLDKQ